MFVAGPPGLIGRKGSRRFSMPCYKELKWVPASHGHVPHGAVVAGHDQGHHIYVARAHHNGEMLPGKLHHHYKLCYVAWGGLEHSKVHYEVLVNPCNLELTWVQARHGELPTGAIQGGRTQTGEALIIGRAVHNGATCVGKVQQSHGVLYITYGGKEIPMREYEVLTARILALDN